MRETLTPPIFFFSQAQTNALYASMVLSWSVTEVIRYAFYASSLLSMTPYHLLYLRYTTFYVLYPTGASSEALLNLSTLPGVTLSWRGVSFPGVGELLQVWDFPDYVRLAAFLVWWPCACLSPFLFFFLNVSFPPLALYVLYTHMIRIRSKVLATGPTLSVNGAVGEKAKTQ
jgi:very-long-chain (3R)-3-hydroxyacyl-CoA dehydratase